MKKETIMAKKLKNIHIDFHNSDYSADYLAVTQVKELPKGFIAVPDRKQAVPESVKVHWDKLNRSSHGVLTPHENKGWITRRFNELAKSGWKVSKSK